MFLLYADASGAADQSDVNTRHYVLLGLAVHEGTWFALDKRLNGLKAAYCQRGDDFELHAAEFACSIKEHRGISLFGEAISKAHPSVVDGHVDPVRQAFEQVVSRFDAFLKRRDEWKLKKSPRRTIDNGLLVLDQDYSMEASIVSQFRDYRRQGHPWGRLLHVIDVPFFAASDRVCGLQLVDICAYAVRRYLDKSTVAGSHEERNFQRIFQRFDRDNLGRLHGLRHYVQAGTCGCLICQERGHAPASEPAAHAPPPAP